MKQIKIEVVFIILDEIAENFDLGNLPVNQVPAAYTMSYIQKHASTVETFVHPSIQLYNVRVDGGEQPNTVEITEDGLLAFMGQPINYLKGEAIKKARMFGGVIVKNTD
jgi:hypothetical protein